MTDHCGLKSFDVLCQNVTTISLLQCYWISIKHVKQNGSFLGHSKQPNTFILNSFYVNSGYKMENYDYRSSLT